MARAEYYFGLTIEGDESLPKLMIDGRCVRKLTKDKNGSFSVPELPKIRTDTIYELGRRIIDSRPELSRARNDIKKTHLKELSIGVRHWNSWRLEYPATRPLLFGADLRKLGLRSLNGVNFANANLIKANLSGMSLIGANFHEANIGKAKLHDANLTGANFCRTDLYETEMQGADLRKANLQGTQLAKTNFRGAKLIDCKVYGMSVWDIHVNKKTVQKNLTIRYGQANDGESRKDSGETRLYVDDLLVSQFMYMLLNNTNLRAVINATTKGIILILGRFTPERKVILDAVRNALRNKWGYVPILFDFKPSDNMDLTETIQLLAGLASFVIADLTDPRSVPQELSHIVPNLASVPILPILLSGQPEYAMFEHWKRYPWVLPKFVYKNQDHLIAHLDDRIITPAKNSRNWTSPQAPLKDAMLEIAKLRRQVKDLKTAARILSTATPS